MQESKENWIVSYPDDGNTVCFEMEDASFWYQHRNMCIVEAVKTNQFAREFYDIGGGNGVTALALQDAGYDITLIEPYLAGIENSRKRGIRKTVHSTLEDYTPEAKGSVRAVGFFDVMEHIEDDKGFLFKINNLLADNGQIILTVPAFMSLWSDNDVQLGHFRRYTLGQLTDLLSQCGFEVKYQSYFFSLVWAPMWLMRVLPNKFGITKKNTPEKKKSEHMAENPGRSGFLKKMLRWEIGVIGRKGKIPVGTSCLVVAKKTKNV